MTQCRKKVIDEGLGAEGLVIQSRMGADPGHDYFMQLTRNLKQVFDELQGDRYLDRELSYALFCLGHYVESEYTAWMAKVAMREDLFDDILRMETAVESIFCQEWIAFDPFTSID
jgi:hypothetical protein